jgi:hypothetical protein
MKFSFKNSPEWFMNYVTETYADEFHEKVKSIGIERLNDDHGPLLEAAAEFFTEKGFRSYCYNRELWFDLDETQETTMLALQWA